MDIGMSSRADEDEKIFAIGNVLHMESHLSEVMESDPDNADKVAPLLDDIRKNRQDLVRLWADNREDVSWWCPSKHSILSEIHVREMLNNASRGRPSDVKAISKILQKVVGHRRSLTKRFLSGNGYNKGKSCARCEDDLGKGAVARLSKALNITSNNLGNKDVHTHTVLKNLTNRGEITMDLKDLGAINGGQFAGKGLVWLSDFADRKLGMAGKPLLKRPSFYANVGGGAAMQLAALKWLENKPKLQLAAVVAGSHALSRGVDYARELMAPTPALRSMARARASPSQALPFEELVTVD